MDLFPLSDGISLSLHISNNASSENLVLLPPISAPDLLAKVSIFSEHSALSFLKKHPSS
jgi:hypothetical protein